MISLLQAINEYKYDDYIYDILSLDTNNFVINDKSQIKLISPVKEVKKTGIMSIAYDYLVRFYLFAKYKNSKDIKITNCFEKENIHLEEFISGLVCIKGIKLLKVLMKESNHPNYNEYKIKFNESIFEIKKAIDSDFKNCDLKSFFKHVIFISYFDPIFKSGIFSKFYNLEIKDSEIEDLNCLYKQLSFLDNKFPNKKQLYLNILIGRINEHIIKSDCDFIIDDVLFDIKSTETLTFGKKELAQLIPCYIAVSKKNIKVNKIGIYYSRFNYLHLIDIKDLKITPDKIKKIDNWNLPKEKPLK